MSGPQPNDPASPADSELPSEGRRTVISFLLFVHLFALGVAIASNAAPVSPLRRQLREVPFIRPYLQLLYMDLGYNFHLTYSEEYDTDHFFELELSRKNTSGPETTKIVLPPSGLRPPIRRGRYHNLALNAARLEGDDQFESLLPKAIAKRLLAEAHVTEGNHRIRCRRHYLLTRAMVGSTDPEVRDPFALERYATVYEADVFFDDQGELQIVKTASATETAPVNASGGR